MSPSVDPLCPERLVAKKDTLSKLIESAQKSQNVAFRVFTLRFAARFFNTLGDHATVRDLLLSAQKICPRELPDYKKLQGDIQKFGVGTVPQIRPAPIPAQQIDMANTLSRANYEKIREYGLSLWVLFRNGAVLCCYNADPAVNLELISAFFVALQNFSMEYVDGSIKRLEMAHIHYQFIEHPDRPIALICRSPSRFDTEELQPLLWAIFEEFWGRFRSEVDGGFNGNVAPYKHFFPSL